MTSNAYRNPTNQTAINAVNNFASMLAGRFSPVVGCTRSWDTTDPTDFQVREMFSVELWTLPHVMRYAIGHH